MLTLISYYQVSKKQVILLLMLTFTAGLANTGMLYLINLAISEKKSITYLAVFLFTILAVYIVSQRNAQKMLFDITEQTLSDIRTGLIEKLLQCEYREVEKIGDEKIISSITTDASSISSAGILIISLCVLLITVISCLIYLCFLSLLGFLSVALIIILGISVYWLISRRAVSYLKHARKTEDIFLKHVKDVTLGIKELKINRERRTEFYFKDIIATCTEAKENNGSAKKWHLYAGLSGNSVFYLLVGAIAILPSNLIGIESQIRSAFLIVLIYLIGPISGLVLNIPNINNAVVSAKRLKKLDDFLSEHKEKCYSMLNPHASSIVSNTMTEVNLIGVSYVYTSGKNQSAFRLGPLDLCIRAGELLFIIGGNGSGKSTLGKVITGLYFPQNGIISVEGKSVSAKDMDGYRQLFSAVYSDYHTFSKLYGLDNKTLNNTSKAMLAQLEIDRKVTISSGQFEFAGLSQGEKKRLALAVSYFENRPIYFFDEWAADQDPIFKEFFYKKLIPSFKSEGKTIIVITHDDRYFKLADRVFRLENGQLEKL